MPASTGALPRAIKPLELATTTSSVATNPATGHGRSSVRFWPHVVVLSRTQSHSHVGGVPVGMCRIFPPILSGIASTGAAGFRSQRAGATPASGSPPGSPKAPKRGVAPARSRGCQRRPAARSTLPIRVRMSLSLRRFGRQSSLAICLPCCLPVVERPLPAMVLPVVLPLVLLSEQLEVALAAHPGGLKEVAGDEQRD